LLDKEFFEKFFGERFKDFGLPRHLLEQPLSGSDIRPVWDGLNSGKQPVHRGYEFPKRSFAFLPIF
jgi:hypothetical protein